MMQDLAPFCLKGKDKHRFFCFLIKIMATDLGCWPQRGLKYNFSSKKVSVIGSMTIYDEKIKVKSSKISKNQFFDFLANFWRFKLISLSNHWY